MKSYKDIYEFPLSVCQAGWIRDYKRQFVAQFEFDDTLLQHNVIAILNGIANPTKPHSFVHNSGMISEGKNNYILIRGWGNLTGTGAHHLPEDEAANIQDTFAEFIVNRLNSFDRFPVDDEHSQNKI